MDEPVLQYTERGFEVQWWNFRTQTNDTLPFEAARSFTSDQARDYIPQRGTFLGDASQDLYEVLLAAGKEPFEAMYHVLRQLEGKDA